MAFLETPRFPADISYGSRGGPMFNTTVVTTANSKEYRNRNWTYPRHQWDVAYGIRDYDDLQTVMDFFYTVGGKANGFRFQDPLDFKSCSYASAVSATDQSLGSGDNATTSFQLKKVYAKGANTLTRLIRRPVAGTTTIAFDGSTVASTIFSVNTATGSVAFVSAPASGVAITCGYEFDVPVRFDSDIFSVSHDFFEVGSTQIPVIELFNE